MPLCKTYSGPEKAGRTYRIQRITRIAGNKEGQMITVVCDADYKCLRAEDGSGPGAFILKRWRLQIDGGKGEWYKNKNRKLPVAGWTLTKNSMTDPIADFVNEIPQCPKCNGLLEYEAEMGAPGYGTSYKCEGCGKKMVKTNTWIDPDTIVPDEEPPWIMELDYVI